MVFTDEEAVAKNMRFYLNLSSSQSVPVPASSEDLNYGEWRSNV
jgi:hypothetical protein